MRLLFPYMARWRSANWSRYHHLLTALARRGHQITVLQAPPLPGARETNYIDLDAPLPAGIAVAGGAGIPAGVVQLVADARHLQPADHPAVGGAVRIRIVRPSRLACTVPLRSVR